MLDPIESDEDMARDYIPLPGGWELQTKGTGSTMRLLDRKTGDRFGLPLPDFAIKKIERMAYEIHGACYSEDLPPMPETSDRGPLDPTDPDGYLESDLDWLRDNPEALTWLIDHHRHIRKALMGVAGDARRHVVCVCPDCTKPARTRDQMREEFESEMRYVDMWGHKSLKRDKSGTYENSWTATMWLVWQAARGVKDPS